MENILFSAGCGQKQSTIWVLVTITRGFTGGSVIKNPPANAGDTGSIPGSGRYPGEENGNPLQYSCLGNPTDRGDLWAIVHRVEKELDIEKKRER